MKTKISQFEFAIMETITPKKAKKFEPRTDEEEINLRQQKLLNQVKNLVIADVSKSAKHCPKCDSKKVMMFTSDMDMCKKCNHQWYV